MEFDFGAMWYLNWTWSLCWRLGTWQPKSNCYKPHLYDYYKTTWRSWPVKSQWKPLWWTLSEDLLSASSISTGWWARQVFRLSACHPSESSSALRHPPTTGQLAQDATMVNKVKANRPIDAIKTCVPSQIKNTWNDYVTPIGTCDTTQK